MSGALSSRTRTVLLLLAGALSAGSAGARAQARPIDVNGLYPAGTVLSSPLTGITFTLPGGFRAEWNRSMGALLAMSTPGVFGSVWGWSNGTIEEAASAVGARLEEQGILVQARGEPEVTADGMRGVFDASTADGKGVLYAAIRPGPMGGVVAIVGLGETASASNAESFVDSVIGSLTWSEPGAAAWTRALSGAVLTWSGDTAAAAALAFCDPAQYSYRDSAAGDAHTGEWWLTADLAGRPELFLQATDGRVLRWPVDEAGGAFLIDGRRYVISGAC
jgi:hypothetical protein